MKYVVLGQVTRGLDLYVIMCKVGSWHNKDVVAVKALEVVPLDLTCMETWPLQSACLPLVWVRAGGAAIFVVFGTL